MLQYSFEFESEDQRKFQSQMELLIDSMLSLDQQRRTRSAFHVPLILNSRAGSLDSKTLENLLFNAWKRGFAHAILRKGVFGFIFVFIFFFI
jgi:hypothetical protein